MAFDLPRLPQVSSLVRGRQREFLSKAELDPATDRIGDL
jgi:hypothetical protein